MGASGALDPAGVAQGKKDGIVASDLKNQTRDQTIGYDGHALLHVALARLTGDNAKAVSAWIWEQGAKGKVPQCAVQVIESALHKATADCKQILEAVPRVYFDGAVPGVKAVEKATRTNVAKESFQEAKRKEVERNSLLLEILRAEHGGETTELLNETDVSEKRKQADALQVSAQKKYHAAAQVAVWPIVQVAVEWCERHRIESFVCLGEADPQLAFDCRVGVIGWIATEDSDLQLYCSDDGEVRVLFGGTKLQKIAADQPNAGHYKVFPFVGSRDLYKRHRPSPQYPDGVPPGAWEKYNWSAHSADAIRLWALLVGQDYSRSGPADGMEAFTGVGLVKADRIVHKLLPFFSDPDALRAQLEAELVCVLH